MTYASPDPDIDPPVPGAGRWPRVHWQIVLAVAVGGFLGGIARYAVIQAWPPPTGGIPWSIFIVNTVGGFILGLLLVTVTDLLPPTTYLRPLIGTGFCGALTTFSTVATGVDQLVAHGHVAAAVSYTVLSLVCGLGAALAGLSAARWAAVHRRHGRQ